MALTFPRRSYAGSASVGSLNAIMNNTTTTFSSASSAPLTNWVEVTGGSFTGQCVVEVEPGTPQAEKILCTFDSGSGNLTIVQRNYDNGTFNVSSGTHAAGSAFVLVASATELAEANAAVQALLPVLNGTNTSTTPGVVGIDVSPNAGASKVAVGVDHTHNLQSSALNTWLTTTASGALPSTVSIGAQYVTAGAFPSGVNLPASQLTAGTLPSGVLASKTWSASNTTAIPGITGYNTYIILIKSQCSYTGANGNFTLSATVNGVTGLGGVGINMTVISTAYALSSFAIAAIGNPATTFSAQLVRASTAGTPTFSNDSIVVIGIN